jgi:hypothetical protein
MKNYRLSGAVTISIYTEVEANSEKEAIEIAEMRSIENGRWNDRHQLTQAWVSDEYDGEPFDITVD